MRIAHVIMQSPFAQQFAENNGGRNEKIFILSNKRKQAKKSQQQVTFISPKELLSIYSLRFHELKRCQILIVHRFHSCMIPLLLYRKKHNLKYIIQTWGKDYMVFNRTNKILLPRTFNSISERTDINFESGFLNSVHDEFFNGVAFRGILKSQKYTVERVVAEIFEEAESIFFCQEQEALTFTSDYNHGGSKRFLYGKLESTLASSLPNPNICLLGNSANCSMNHIDAIARMKDLGLEKVIIPMAYGQEFFKPKILDATRKFLNVPVEFINSWMRLEDYYEIIDKCGLFVHFGLRQQSLGNTMKIILSGGQVLCHSSGLTHKLLDQIGVKHLTEKSDKISPLSKDQAGINASLVERHYRNIQDETSKFIQSL